VAMSNPRIMVSSFLSIEKQLPGIKMEVCRRTGEDQGAFKRMTVSIAE
jgi:hypothetical protein